MFYYSNIWNKWAQNVNFHEELLTRINSLLPGGHVFQQTRTIFEHIHDIIWTNLLTKFHEDWTINEKTAKTIFKLIQDIIWSNLLTKFHEGRTMNVASSVNKENAPPSGGHVFQPTRTIFKLIQDIIGTYLLTKFHLDWTINVASKFNCYMPPYRGHKNAPPSGGHVFQPTGTNFLLVQDIFGTNLLNKFHEDRTLNVASIVLTRNERCVCQKHNFSDGRTDCHTDRQFNYYMPPYRGIKMPNPWWPFIIGTNLLTQFHDERTINADSRVLTRNK
ncbi:hypothetical protein DPMN_110800 [Dreissena polymorpha]|uniref:Uncharacterized protein n=1 Tax=Dreissena polymorpha TaxID=45954 RepID=A0A9D4KD31_DREPO|nr:hypothetical protein DPMN_110800 [Dreissena polymorpha]